MYKLIIYGYDEPGLMERSTPMGKFFTVIDWDYMTDSEARLAGTRMLRNLRDRLSQEGMTHIWVYMETNTHSSTRLVINNYIRDGYVRKFLSSYVPF